MTRAARSGRPEGRTDAVTVRLSGPGDAVSAVPHLLGFQPQESLVAVGLTGPRRRFGPVMRLDLAGAGPPTTPGSAARIREEQAIVDQAVRLLLRCAPQEVLLVVYTEESAASAVEPALAPLPRRELVFGLRDALGSCDVGLRDALVVRDGRWFSFVCDDPGCCPIEGTPVTGDLPTAAELALRVELGQPYASRSELAARVAAVVPPGATRQLGELVTALRSGRPGTRAHQLERTIDHALALVADGRPIPDAELILLAALVQEVTCRDTAVTRPGFEQLPDAVELWRQVLVATPAPWDAQVGSILTSIAWELGRGALAACASERVFATDPFHRLTLLTVAAMQQGLRFPQREPQVGPGVQAGAEGRRN